MQVTTKTTGGIMAKAPEPQRTSFGGVQAETYVYGAQGTAIGPNLSSDRTSLWGRRWNLWREGFEQGPGPQQRRYWGLYRAFDSNPLPGPNMGWRDRTVIPQVFKVIENRSAHLARAMFSRPDWIPIESTDEQDEEYEELVRILMEKQFRGIGKNDHEGGIFLRRVIDSMKYCEITGQLFAKLWWRKRPQWTKTQIPVLNEEGEVESWKPVEIFEMIHDGLDYDFVPNDSIAIDLSGARKWIIERQRTSLESLKAENDNYHEATGQWLYDPHKLEQLEFGAGFPAIQQDSFEEPRDTEHWPLTDEHIVGTPGETSVELWLCWDNQERTLTKVANRTMELAHGLSPTPDGLDPYISVPAVPIPRRVYGDSIIHYIGSLQTSQTRIRRARNDEILLNLWQQWIFRSGVVTSNQGIFTPGGAIEIDSPDPSKPILHDIATLPRHPVFSEAWTEEQAAQQQSEAVAGTDSISMGTEATSKSRDVSATETQQRVLQGSVRKSVDHLYWEAAFKIPLLQKSFDLIKQNMTQATSVRVLGKDITVDLRALDRPVDFAFGQDLFGPAKVEEGQRLQEEVQLAHSPVFGDYIRPREVLLDKYRNWGVKSVQRKVRTDEEVEQIRRQRAAGAQGPQQAQPAKAKGSPQAAGVGDAAKASGGEGGLSGPGGEGPKPPPASSASSVEYV